MKKIVTLFMVFVLGCIATFSLTACNDGNLSGNGNGNDDNPEIPATSTATLVYEKSGDGYAVTGMTGDEKNIVIPAEHEGLSVTTIKESAFAYSRHTAIYRPLRFPIP